MFIESDKAFVPDGSLERELPRTRVLMNALLVSAAGKTSVRLRDLSPTGAQVLSEVPLLPNSDLLFCKGRASVAARIAWVRCKSAGLTFYRELSLEEADYIFGGHERPAAIQFAELSGLEEDGE